MSSNKSLRKILKCFSLPFFSPGTHLKEPGNGANCASSFDFHRCMFKRYSVTNKIIFFVLFRPTFHLIVSITFCEYWQSGSSLFKQSLFIYLFIASMKIVSPRRVSVCTQHVLLRHFHNVPYTERSPLEQLQVVLCTFV